MCFTPAQPLASRCQQYRRTGNGPVSPSKSSPSLNPRVTRNPGYDALKASILARGLDNPPVLTRRPGDEKYMLASGGNTHLAILNELWQETQDERYHRVCWPFRPWPETLSPQQGEVQCLIGHLAESDLHNGLMFIERAEGILHLRDLYLEAGIECPTQLALAEQLTRDGYPVSQSQISRMLQTVDWLLPCIPNALYGGLTRKVIDRLLALRSAAEQVWVKLMPLERQPEFADLFSTALATFNGEPEAVVPQLVQDELLGEMSCRSGISWNTLLAELTDGQSKRQVLLGPPVEKVLWPPPPEVEKHHYQSLSHRLNPPRPMSQSPHRWCIRHSRCLPAGDWMPVSSRTTALRPISPSRLATIFPIRRHGAAIRCWPPSNCCCRRTTTTLRSSN